MNEEINKKEAVIDLNYTNNVISVIHTTKQNIRQNEIECLLYLKYCIICGNIYTSYYISSKTCCYKCSRTNTKIKKHSAIAPYDHINYSISKADRIKYSKMGFKLP